eukprot:12904896-Prorocentrum_lima.AAC.1
MQSTPWASQQPARRHGRQPLSAKCRHHFEIGWGACEFDNWWASPLGWNSRGPCIGRRTTSCWCKNN